MAGFRDVGILQTHLDRHRVLGERGHLLFRRALSNTFETFEFNRVASSAPSGSDILRYHNMFGASLPSCFSSWFRSDKLACRL